MLKRNETCWERNFCLIKSNVTKYCKCFDCLIWTMKWCQYLAACKWSPWNFTWVKAGHVTECQRSQWRNCFPITDLLCERFEILEQNLDFLYQVDKISVNGGDKNVLLLQVLAKEKKVVVFRERFFISTLKKTQGWRMMSIFIDFLSLLFRSQQLGICT